MSPAEAKPSKRILVGDRVEVVAYDTLLPSSAGIHAYDGSRGEVLKINPLRTGRHMYLRVERRMSDGSTDSRKVWVPERGLKGPLGQRQERP